MDNDLMSFIIQKKGTRLLRHPADIIGRITLARRGLVKEWEVRNKGQPHLSEPTHPKNILPIVTKPELIEP